MIMVAEDIKRMPRTTWSLADDYRQWQEQWLRLDPAAMLPSSTLRTHHRVYPASLEHRMILDAHDEPVIRYTGNSQHRAFVSAYRFGAITGWPMMVSARRSGYARRIIVLGVAYPKPERTVVGR